MSLLTYNGVSLPYSNLTHFRCEAVYDDSGTDYLCTKFDIGVQFLVTEDTVFMLMPDLEGRMSSPAGVLAMAHRKLLQPRKRLKFEFNGVDFIPEPAGVDGTVDVKNGPMPQSFTPIQITNTTWLCQYHIVAHYRIYYDLANLAGSQINDNLPGNVVLSHRWGERVQINDLEMTTRVRTGKFMIRSDNEEGLVADAVRRQTAVFGPPAGFLRHASEYSIDPSGLAIQYSLTDREQFRMPPDPAYRAQGEYSEEGTKADGKRIGSCWVRLWGAKDTPQWKLLSTAFGVVSATLDSKGATFFNAKPHLRGLVLASSFRWGMYDNWVEARMTVFYKLRPERVNGVCLVRPDATLIPGSDGQFPERQYTARGSAGLLLQAASYYDADIRDQGLRDDGMITKEGDGGPLLRANQRTFGKRPGEAGKTPE